MYCSACGLTVTQGLSYCNHCGARLSRDESLSKADKVEPDLLIPSIVVTFIFGLLLIVILMGVMKAVLGLPVELILATMSLPFLLMLVLEGVFIRLLFRRSKPADATVQRTLPASSTTNELDTTNARVLAEGGQSVTEHTTRAFDPIHLERK